MHSSTSYHPICLHSATSSVDPTYFDNCASYHLAASLDTLDTPTQCTIPWFIGGVTQGLQITHQGYLKPMPGLPLSRAASKAYWGPGSHQTIISLGFLQHFGYSYLGSNHSLTIYNKQGTVVHTSPLSANNFHAPASLPVISPTLSLPNPASSQVTPAQPSSPTKPDSSSPLLLPLKITATHIQLCHEAEQLHISLLHPSDESLCQALDNSSIPNTTVTSTMVRLNRKLRGKCPQCLQGKLHADHKPSSTKNPALTCGQIICLDLKKLPLGTISGKTQRIICVDEASGSIHFTMAHSKTTAGLLAPIVALIAEKFNAHGHTVSQIKTDNEAVFRSLAAPLGTMAISVSLSAPGQHQGTAERATRTIEDRSRAVIASLPYQLPQHLAIYADYAVASAHNNLPNSASLPHTPNEILTGIKSVSHHKYPHLPFGQSCMVQLLSAKRAADSSPDKEILRMPKAELGVNLGPDPLTPTASYFYLGNNSVVSAKRFEPVNITTPFGWKAQHQLQASLIPDQFHPHNFPLSPLPPLITSSVTDTLLPQLTQPQLPTPQPQLLLPSPHDIHSNNIPWPLIPTGPTLPSTNSPPPTHHSTTQPPVLPPPQPPTQSQPTKTISRPTTRSMTRASQQSVSHDTSLGLSSLLASFALPSSPLALPSVNRDTSASLHLPLNLSNEISVAKALQNADSHLLRAAIDKKMLKMTTHEVFTPIRFQDIPSNAVKIFSIMFCKIKLSGRITARLAAGGDRQPPDSYLETYAPTADSQTRSLCLAAFMADAVKRHIHHLVAINDFDVPGAFLHMHLTTANCPRPIVIPSHLGRPMGTTT